MINLIPTEDKKVMIRDFYFRLLATFFIMLGFSFLIATVVLVPSYVLSVEKKNFTNQKLEIQKNEPVPEIDQKAMAVLEGLNSKLDIIQKARRAEYDTSQKVIKEIISKKVPGIKILRIDYEYDITKNKSITMNGKATSREQLLLFRQSLEGDKAFSKVDLPISNFVKDADIEFNLNLIPA